MKHLLKYVVRCALFLAGAFIVAYGALCEEEAVPSLIGIGLVVAFVQPIYSVVASHLSKLDRKRRR